MSTILCQARICHAVVPPHHRLQRDDSLQSGHGFRLTGPADILLYSWCGDFHCCADLVGLSPACGGWRDAAFALVSVEQGKREKHAHTCLTHGFDFNSFGFSSLGSFGPAAEELLSRFCQRNSSYARVSSWEAHSSVFRRLSFAVMRGVVKQFVGQKLTTFGW